LFQFPTENPDPVVGMSSPVRHAKLRPQPEQARLAAFVWTHDGYEAWACAIIREHPDRRIVAGPPFPQLAQERLQMNAFLQQILT
jgi:hypothetical protein